MESLNYLEEIHGTDPDAAIIWMHGLGADGYDFQPIVRQLNLPDEQSIHFIFPHAPVQPVSINQGVEVNAWYDILELSLEAKEDHEGISASMNAIEKLITTKLAHIDPERIILAGFSQGGAMALHTFLHGNLRFAGVIALSTYLPLRNLANQADINRISGQEIFMAHGTHDEVLPHEIGELARNILLTLGANISWHSYTMAHEVCQQQVQEIREWILQRLAS